MTEERKIKKSELCQMIEENHVHRNLKIFMHFLADWERPGAALQTLS